MLRVLMVVNKRWWEYKCPPFWPEQYQALAACPGVDIRVTGERWAGWKNQRTLRENINRLMPEADVVYLWRPLGIVEFPGILGSEESLPQLKVSAYQDDPKISVPEAQKVGLDLLFYHDHWDRQFFEGCGIRSVYLPLAVNLSLYKNWDTPYDQRKVSTILTGSINPEVYPLRVTFQRMLQRKMIAGHIRKAPGYRLPSLKRVLQEQARYANSLTQSKVSLVSSCPHIPLTLRKYFESLAAGCVLFGDVPAEPPTDVAKCINVIHSNMSYSDIVSKIQQVLMDKEECERQRVRNRKVAEAYSYIKFAQRWVDAVKVSLAEKSAFRGTVR